MKLILCFIYLIPATLLAQTDQAAAFGIRTDVAFNSIGFPFGALEKIELEMKTYDKDTAAVALVLNEFGETQMDKDENVYSLYHVRIKILKSEGLKWANQVVELHHDENKIGTLNQIQASTFNYENNSIKEFKLDERNVVRERKDKSLELVKFTLPEVKVGSIIEIKYVITLPLKFEWNKWAFQSEIPKRSSEFRAQMPGNLLYKITLKGILKLDESESTPLPKCIRFGPKASVDCALLKYGMKDIPAFKEESYMTSPSDYISSLVIQLSEINRVDGSQFKYTKEWKDINSELQSSNVFGNQVKQAKKLWSSEIELVVKNTEDPLIKAKLIFEKIKNYYSWNKSFNYSTELGAKKAFQEKTGNVADINLSLIGALQAAGFQVDPILISTRDHGLPVTINPVPTDFNYVIARLAINDKQYWLDATDTSYPFDFIPKQCLNGKGRPVGNSFDWVEIKPKDKDKRTTETTLAVDATGNIVGIMKIVHHGYDAWEKRKQIHSYASLDDYRKALTKDWSAFQVTNYSCLGIDSLDKPVTEKFEIQFKEKADKALLYFSPFLVDRWVNNPFRPDVRKFPVDFGVQMEETTILSLDYKSLFTVDEFPKSTALALPLAGGRFAFNVSNLNNKIQMTSTLSLGKSVYSPEEYHYLKDLFARVVQTRQSQFVLTKIK